MKKHINFNSLIWSIALIALIIILYWRFQVSMQRFFDQDEFYHLYRAYLISTGQIAYRDFGSFYSPVFSAVFAPLFYFFQEQITPVLLSRSLEFLIFCGLVFISGLIGWAMSGIKVGLTAAYLIAFLPLAFDKTLEVRPDTLAILFYFLSFFFLLTARKRPTREGLFCLAGACMGMSLLINIKTVFVYPGLLVYLLTLTRNLDRKYIKNLLSFHSGAILPWLGLIVVLWFFQVTPGMVLDTFITHWQIYQNFNNIYFYDSFWPFRANEFLYGSSGINLILILNHFILLVGLLGLVVSRLRVFLIISFISLFFTATSKSLYPVPLIQYYLPFMFILVLAAADFLGLLCRRVEKYSKRAALLIWIVFFSVFSWGLWKKVGMQYYWTNQNDINNIKTILSVSRPGDHFYDQLGIHFFRPSGNYFCCDFLNLFPPKILGKYPRLQNELKKNQNKFLFDNESLWKLPKTDIQFLKENYFPSGVEKILVAGKEIMCPIKEEKEFELLVTGTYRLTKNFTGDILLDNQRPVQEEVVLSSGKHKISCSGTGKISLLLNYTK